MSGLKSCPCGAVPKVLHISTSASRYRYAFVSEDCMELAVEAWNAAKRNQEE